MGMDLVYVRFPERLLELALRDKQAARALAGGAPPAALASDESMEDIDLARQQRSLYRVLADSGSLEYWDSSDPNDWVKLALIGERLLPDGCDPSVYGPSRYLTSARVLEIAARLEPTDDTSFRASYERFISRNGLLRPDLGGDNFETTLLPQFKALRRFYLEARRQKQAVVITPT